MRLGVYGPNRRVWDLADYDAIDEAGVRDVIVRSDCAPEVFDILLSRGVAPYLQFTDFFAAHPQSDPGTQAMRLLARCRELLPDGGYVILDNEPDLGPTTSGQWGAEQWTRWYRAVYNVFRFYDDAGRYKLIYPAVKEAPEPDRFRWWSIGAENIAGHHGVGLHWYWSAPEEFTSIPAHDYFADWQDAAGGRPLIILEFGSPASANDWTRRKADYLQFGWCMGYGIEVGFAFILNPTPDWGQYAITGEQLIELARAWPR